ncbi:MAG: hypothetical protein VYC52_06440 [Pseudomonadota bacterium]|nr:hypothetical protein [Pseudomonadota bacterium]
MDFEQALYRAETPLIPPHYGEASLAMFIARPVAELASSSQQDGKQLNVTQLIGAGSIVSQMPEHQGFSSTI